MTQLAENKLKVAIKKLKLNLLAENFVWVASVVFRKKQKTVGENQKSCVFLRFVHQFLRKTDLLKKKLIVQDQNFSPELRGRIVSSFSIESARGVGVPDVQARDVQARNIQASGLKIYLLA